MWERSEGRNSRKMKGYPNLILTNVKIKNEARGTRKPTETLECDNQASVLSKLFSIIGLLFTWQFLKQETRK